MLLAKESQESLREEGNTKTENTKFSDARKRGDNGHPVQGGKVHRKNIPRKKSTSLKGTWEFKSSALERKYSKLENKKWGEGIMKKRKTIGQSMQRPNRKRWAMRPGQIGKRRTGRVSKKKGEVGEKASLEKKKANTTGNWTYTGVCRPKPERGGGSGKRKGPKRKNGERKTKRVHKAEMSANENGRPTSKKNGIRGGKGGRICRREKTPDNRMKSGLKNKARNRNHTPREKRNRNFEEEPREKKGDRKKLSQHVKRGGFFFEDTVKKRKKEKGILEKKETLSHPRGLTSPVAKQVDGRVPEKIEG